MQAYVHNNIKNVQELCSHGCKRHVGVRDRDETETFKFLVRDETETVS